MTLTCVSPLVAAVVVPVAGGRRGAHLPVHQSPLQQFHLLLVDRGYGVQLLLRENFYPPVGDTLVNWRAFRFRALCTLVDSVFPGSWPPFAPSRPAFRPGGQSFGQNLCLWIHFQLPVFPCHLLHCPSGPGEVPAQGRESWNSRGRFGSPGKCAGDIIWHNYSALPL